jgi:hypothetical protein
MAHNRGPEPTTTAHSRGASAASSDVRLWSGAAPLVDAASWLAVAPRGCCDPAPLPPAVRFATRDDATRAVRDRARVGGNGRVVVAVAPLRAKERIPATVCRCEVVVGVVGAESAMVLVRWQWCPKSVLTPSRGTLGLTRLR